MFRVLEIIVSLLVKRILSRVNLAQHPAQPSKWSCLWKKTFYKKKKKKKGKRRFAINPSSFPLPRVRVSTSEMERMRSLRSRSVKLLPLETDAAVVGAYTSRGTRVYAFSSVAPRKKLGIGGRWRGGAEVGASEKGKMRAASRLSSFQFDRFARRAPISFLCPLKRGISFRLKGGTFFLPSSSFSSPSNSVAERMWTLDVVKIEKMKDRRIYCTNPRWSVVENVANHWENWIEKKTYTISLYPYNIEI